MPEKPYAAWLPMLPETVPDTCRTPADTAAFELKQAGLELVEKGITTMDELEKIAYNE